MAGKRFVGFGFGPIQSGLMLLEAQASGNFDAYCIAEIDRETVEIVRKAGCRIAVNVAGGKEIRSRILEGFEILNPSVEADRARLIQEVREADELATAIPSVEYYEAGGPSSIAAVLAAGLEGKSGRILYACENNNHAARILESAIEGHAGKPIQGALYVLDTVIGKMSGAVSSQDIDRLGLAPMTPDSGKAVLVEEFNRILVSRPPAGITRGLSVFAEREDLMPFEEAKLYGHNAVHCLLGYLGHLQGYQVMSRIRENQQLLDLGLRAFMDESGAAMMGRHGGTDELFTPAGYLAYAQDLLDRMTNPHLHDAVARICRDPARKLGWDDRIFGTMRRVLEAGVTPRIMALAGAAAIRYARDTGELWAPEGRGSAEVLRDLWGEQDASEMDRCEELVMEAEKLINRGAYL